MANRVMQQKGAKEKRQRRAWARPLSIASGSRPNRGVLSEYRERTLTLGVPEYEVDELIKVFYGREPIQGVPPGRVEVQNLLARLKKIVPQMLFFVVPDVPDNIDQRTVCFFNPGKTCFVIAHTDRKKKVTRTSMEYGSKDSALSKFYSGKTVWVNIRKEE